SDDPPAPDSAPGRSWPRIAAVSPEALTERLPPRRRPLTRRPAGWRSLPRGPLRSGRPLRGSGRRRPLGRGGALGDLLLGGPTLAGLATHLSLSPAGLPLGRGREGG